MNGFGDQLLSRSAFTGDQYSRAGRRHLFDKPENFLHDIGATHNRAAIDRATHRAPKRPSFFLFSPAFDPRGNSGGNLIVLEGLSNATKSSMLPGGDCRIKG